MHDLVEIEETMASVENKHEEGLLNHVKEAVESSSVKQVIEIVDLLICHTTVLDR